MTPTTTQLRRGEWHRIKDADPMLLADGLTTYERTVWFQDLDEQGRVIKTDVYAVYTRGLGGGSSVTFFRKPFQPTEVTGPWNKQS
jgi:hypothetical protein